MSTAQSPLWVLKAQSDTIAKMIKAAGRGEPVAPEFAARLAAAQANPEFVVGVVMDDKFLKITLLWSTIRDSSEVGLAEYILKHMREARDDG